MTRRNFSNQLIYRALRLVLRSILTTMWNATYPYLLSIRDREQVYETRYATYGEAMAVYLEHLIRPVAGVTVELPYMDELQTQLTF